MDQHGNVYVADTENQLIRKISPAAVVTTVAGVAGERGTVDGPARSARFNEPHTLAIDGLGNLFVTEEDHTIRKITPAGVVSTLAGTTGKIGKTDGTGGAALFSSPSGMVADATGNLFVADTDNFTIRKITPSGVVTTYAGIPNFQGGTDGPAATATFRNPRAMAMDALGNLYVSTGANGGTFSDVIRKITPAGMVSTLPGSDCGPHAGIRGIAIDAAGNFFISLSNYCVRRLTPGGVNTVFAGSEWDPGNRDGVAGSARFRASFGVSIDRAGNLYLAGGVAPVIRKIDPAGAVTTFAGQASGDGSADGNGLAARFLRPMGITGDSAGNLFVADAGNCTIRRISANGDVTTWVGSPTSPADTRAAPPSYTRDAWAGPTLALDSSGNLFGVAYPSSRLHAISPAKVVTTIASSGDLGAVDGPAGSAKLGHSLRGVAVDGAGTLFITDGDAVRKIARDGSISTLAGSIVASGGSADGVGSSARFLYPSGLAVDRTGTVFVSDSGNDTIRKITPDGVVSTLAGSPGQSGNTDGQGRLARFSSPGGIAFDAAGNLYVADCANGAVRKVSPAGGVTKLTGFHWDDYYYADGTGGRARLLAPSGIWVSPQGELYITDAEANVVVKGVLDRVPAIATPPQPTSAVVGAPVTFAVTATGGGLSYQWTLNGTAIAGATDATYTIAAATTAAAGSYQVDIRNSAGSITSPRVALTVIEPTTPAISADPQSASAFIGTPALFSVTASGGGLAYQWRFNAEPIAGATRATYSIPSVVPAHAGHYTVDISNPVGTITSRIASLVVTTPGRLMNLSVLTALTSSVDSFTVGLGVGGAGVTGPKPLLVRAMGPSLARVGVQDPVEGALLAVYRGTVKTDENRGWRGDASIAAASARVGAFAFASPASADSAVYLSDATGSGRTFTVSGTGSGAVLAEVYDATPAAAYTLATPRLSNLSVLKTLTGGLTAGFSIGGHTRMKVLIRAVGPGLSGFGVSDAVARPKLEVFDASGSSLATNAGWGGATELSAAFILGGAFALERGSADAALLLELAPGNYTVQVTAADGMTGVALLEVYEIR